MHACCLLMYVPSFAVTSPQVTGVNSKILALESENLVVDWCERAKRTEAQFAGFSKFQLAGDKAVRCGYR